MIPIAAASAAAVSVAASSAQESGLPSLWDLTVSGGPLMIPLFLCSILALAYAIERAFSTREGALGSEVFARTLVETVKQGGPAQGVMLCDATRTPLARIMRLALEHAAAPRAEREKRVEDAASTEVRRLQARLRPLHLIYLVAPLLGLLGTVWGMILAFATIATRDGLGKPGLLAEGVYQALVTTAAGLVIAIPTVVVLTWLRGRVERFARRTEEVYSELDRGLPTVGA